MTMKAVRKGGPKTVRHRDDDVHDDVWDGVDDGVVMVMFPGETWRKVIEISEMVGDGSTVQDVMGAALELLYEKVKEKSDGSGTG